MAAAVVHAASAEEPRLFATLAVIVAGNGVEALAADMLARHLAGENR